MTAKLRLGFGCSGVWAERYFSEKQAIALIREAVDQGVRAFDTAAFYANGQAEARLGAALKEIPSADVFISTKTGTRIMRGRKVKDFSPHNMRRDVEASLKRLGAERLDVVHLHGPSPTQIDEAAPALREMKTEGKIGRIGVCGAGTELSHAVESEHIDAIMCAYNILHREHQGVMRAAKAKGMNVYGVAPLAQALYRPGFLAPRSIADLWYLARALVKNRAELSRARAARILTEIEGWSPTALALGFALANADIDIAFLNTTRSAHLRANAAAAQRPLPDDLRRTLIAALPT